MTKTYLFFMSLTNKNVYIVLDRGPDKYFSDFLTKICRGYTLEAPR